MKRRKNSSAAADADLLASLRLARSDGVGAHLFQRLLGNFGDAQRALEALPDLARRGGKRGPLRICPAAAAQAEIEAVAAIGGRLIALGGADYPPALAAIADPPPVIAVLGDAGLLARPSLAIVGARNASLNGRRMAADLAAAIGAGGMVVVSGLARGIDAAAHDAALATGTVACVAGGIDTIYPRENEKLHAAIAERGCIVAEAPFGAAPTARHFPRRNRVISGLSLGTVVIEAALGSGSLITARQALEQGREIFAVPGSPLDPRCRGTNDLIRQGAYLVESIEDIRANLGTGAQPSPAKRAEIAEPASVESAAPERADADQAMGQDLAELLGTAPTEIDALVRQTGLGPASIAAGLLELELAGRLERHPNNTVSLLA